MYSGKTITVPLPAGEGTGLGKPLNVMDYPVRPDIPIWWAALTPKAVETAAELADGWIPIHLIPEKVKEVWGGRSRPAWPAAARGACPFEINSGSTWPSARTCRSRSCATSTARSWPCTWAAWAPAARTSTTTWPSLSASPTRPRSSRTFTWTARRRRPPPHVPAEWLEKAQLIGPRSYIKERLAAYRGRRHHRLSVHPVGGQDPVKVIEQMRELVDDI